jgi:hypothetical protein
VKPVTLVYILGSGHCGSTLLTLLLNSHSRMLGLSALRKLDTVIAHGTGDYGPNPLEGELWQRVREHYERVSGQPFAQINIHHPGWRTFLRWDKTRIEAWAAPARDLLASIAAESGRDFLIDSSKAWQQLYLLKRSGLVRLKVLHGLRDGRGVFHSYNRKYGKFGHSFGQWAKPTLMAALLRPLFSRDEWMEVRYEALASAPDETLREICEFLGADYEPEMLRYRQKPWVGILGNRMAHDGSEAIRLDEKWRRELDRRDRVLFDLLGGPLNRYFGYRYFADR